MNEPEVRKTARVPLFVRPRTDAVRKDIRTHISLRKLTSLQVSHRSTSQRPTRSEKIRWRSYCEDTTMATYPATSSIGSVLNRIVLWRLEKTHQRLNCSKINRSGKTQSATLTNLVVWLPSRH